MYSAHDVAVIATAKARNALRQLTENDAVYTKDKVGHKPHRQMRYPSIRTIHKGELH
jgi:hypothetical protein